MDVERYLESLVPERPPRMVAMEQRARAARFPIIGPVAGHFCYLMTRLLGARRVFEMGSGFGYSTAWFAQGVTENGGGEVYHVVWDAALSEEARGHLAALGLDGVIRYEVGEAIAVLRRTAGPFDIIFNDINKDGYPAALPVLAEKLRRGGLLITDNMLWGGRIFDASDRSAATEGVREFTRLIRSDPRWVSSLVPVRDGLLLAMRR